MHRPRRLLEERAAGDLLRDRLPEAPGRRRGAGAGVDERLPLEVVEERREAGPFGHRLDDRERKVPSDDGGALEGPLRLLPEPVDPGGHDRLHRVGERGGRRRDRVGAEGEDQLLEEEGVPLGPAEDRLGQLGVEQSTGGEVMEQSLGIDEPQLLEREDLGRDPHAARRLPAGAGGEEEDEGPPGGLVAAEGEELEGQRVGPVEILEDDEGGAAGRQGPQQLEVGGESRRLRLAVRRLGALLGAEVAGEGATVVVGEGEVGQPLLDLPAGVVAAVGVVDAEEAPHHLEGGGEGGLAPMVEAAADGDREAGLGRAPRDLGAEPGLADSRLADEGERRSLAGESPVEGLREARELPFTPDERGARSGARRRLRDGEAPLQPEDRHRLLLPLGLDRRKLVEVEEGSRRAPDRLRDVDLPPLGRRLDPLRGVHRVPHHGVVPLPLGADRAGDDHAAVDADVDRQRDRQLRVQARERLLHFERGAAGPLRVVLVGDRRAEERHDAVADELVDHPAVARNRLAERLEAAVHDHRHLFRVELLAHGREAGDVGEEDGDDLPLAARQRRRRAGRSRKRPGRPGGRGGGRTARRSRAELRAALAAELLPRRVLGRAGGATNRSRGGSFSPHSPQNFWPSGFSWLQPGQITKAF